MVKENSQWLPNIDEESEQLVDTEYFNERNKKV